MLLQNPSLVFKVRRNPPELVAPAGPTPHETKLLSDIDDQKGLRYNIPLVQIFRYHPSMALKDPVHVIRQALAKTLVFYYPLAGRLREGPNDKLMVDCNEEGVMFIEADADVTLDQFGIEIHPPIPCFDELLYSVPGSDGVINCPIVLLQVTRLKCGGLICGIRMNHVIVDGIGMNMFMKALTEMARGEPKPSILPVWRREILCARNPPRVTCIHHEYQQLPLLDDSKSNYQHLSFFVGPKEIAAMRRLLPHHVAASASTFEVLTACLWRCHTTTMQWQNPDQEVRLLSIVNARFGPCRLNPPIPDGFYGNAAVFPAAVSTMRMLCNRPLGYALELVKKAKNEATEEYVHSAADLMAIKGRPYFTRTGSLIVSDHTKVWLRDVDYGWGKSLFNGLAKTNLGEFHDVSACIPYTNSKGEQGRLVLICLPQEAIERFEAELNGILNIKDKDPIMLMSNL